MKVRKAVIPAAGLGTRVLPASKAVPKEMLPIVDKPAIQYIVEEAVASGIEDILIITNRGKSLIEDHFDHAPELEDKLRSSGKQDLFDQVVSLAHLCNIQYVRQKETRGLGHAVGCAKSFVGNEPFAVLYGDDVVISPPGKPAIGELIAVHETYGKSVVGIKEVPDDLLRSYCTLGVKPVQNAVYEVFDMIEAAPRRSDFKFCNSGAVRSDSGHLRADREYPALPKQRSPADRRDAHPRQAGGYDGDCLHRETLRYGKQARDFAGNH